MFFEYVKYNISSINTVYNQNIKRIYLFNLYFIFLFISCNNIVYNQQNKSLINLLRDRPLTTIYN
jgi:hypothetical protein